MTGGERQPEQPTLFEAAEPLSMDELGRMALLESWLYAQYDRPERPLPGHLHILGAEDRYRGKGAPLYAPPSNPDQYFISLAAKDIGRRAYMESGRRQVELKRNSSIKGALLRINKRVAKLEGERALLEETAAGTAPHDRLHDAAAVVERLIPQLVAYVRQRGDGRRFDFDRTFYLRVLRNDTEYREFLAAAGIEVLDSKLLHYRDMADTWERMLTEGSPAGSGGERPQMSLRELQLRLPSVNRPREI